ncbi:MAG: biotin--[acetyl-CoA-carboxylase] ligase [Eubacterium sp.]|nr:biotin--[acetyl-CoA-carboxylase] ligase [Eubacterium sp.]
MKKEGFGAEEIKAYLNSGINVVYYPVTDSTNTQAKRLVSECEEDALLVVADAQTEGRGRLGRSFYSPESTGIYMSLAIKCKKPLGDYLKVTAAAAVAVCRAIEELTNLEPFIKWVNDIYVGGKKVCGILCESVTDGRSSAVIIGIGINVNTVRFPEDLKNAGSLKVELDRAKLAAKIAALTLELTDKDGGEYLDYYRSRSFVTGKKITVIKNGSERSAEAVGIDGSFGLTVRYDGEKEETLNSGEISIRI